MTDARRVDQNEGANTFTERELHKLIQELDTRLTSKDCYAVFTRTLGVTTKVEFFRDIGHTDLAAEKNYTYVVGLDGINRIDTMTLIIYNVDGSEDSRVTTTLNRTLDSIDDCESPFSTSEVTKL